MHVSKSLRPLKSFMTSLKIDLQQSLIDFKSLPTKIDVQRK